MHRQVSENDIAIIIKMKPHTSRKKRKIRSLVIAAFQVEDVKMRAWVAPASFASILNYLVSRVDWAPVPAITVTWWNS